MTKKEGNKWYILNVVSGQENKIAAEIKSLFLSNITGPSAVADVLVPSKQVIKVVRGKKVQEAQKLFPSYVFVNMDMANLAACSRILSIPKAMGFLGPKNNPEAVSDERVEEILKTCSGDAALSDQALSVKMGDSVNVIDGPFDSFSGVVEEFDQEKQKVKISILIFGRATSVELELSQIQKI